MSDHKVTPAAPLRPEERINTFSAQPDDAEHVTTATDDRALGQEQIEFGAMNEADAKASGYIGDDGRAVDTAKPHDGTRLGADL